MNHSDFPFDDAGFPDQETPPHEERLSIALLMLWTAMTAVLLGFDRATSQPTNGELGILPQVMSFVSSPLIGVGLTAWMLMLWRWFTHGPRFPSQPGHWLLLLFGFTSVTSLVVRTIVLLSLAGIPGFSVYVGIHVITEVLAIILYAVAIAATRDRWRLLFWVGLLTSALGMLTILFMSLDFRLVETLFFIRRLLAWGFCLGMLGLVVADLRDGIRRDNLHWAGVVVIGGYLIYATALPFLISWLR